jgi:hypothetical protein
MECQGCPVDFSASFIDETVGVRRTAQAQGDAAPIKLQVIQQGGSRGWTAGYANAPLRKHEWEKGRVVEFEDECIGEHQQVRTLTDQGRE